MSPETSEVGVRRIGRPPRDVPPAVANLVQRSFERRARVTVPLPADVTTEEVDRFRLDARAAGKHLSERVYVQLTGVTESGRAVNVDKRRDRELWADLVTMTVYAYLPMKGSLR